MWRGASGCGASGRVPTRTKHELDCFGLLKRGSTVLSGFLSEGKIEIEASSICEPDLFQIGMLL